MANNKFTEQAWDIYRGMVKDAKEKGDKSALVALRHMRRNEPKLFATMMEGFGKATVVSLPRNTQRSPRQG